MGEVKEPKPVKLFASLIGREENIFQKGMEDLSLNFGKIDFVSERYSFHFTDYYTPEMGQPLYRYFITFEPLLDIPQLPESKQTTNALEKRYATSKGDRRLNIDPGYLCREHVVLATTKAYAHRPYLRQGIYADLTLIYRNKSFRPLEWTYPDYRQKEVIELFNDFRSNYMNDLKRREQNVC